MLQLSQTALPLHCQSWWLQGAAAAAAMLRCGGDRALPCLQLQLVLHGCTGGTTPEGTEHPMQSVTCQQRFKTCCSHHTCCENQSMDLASDADALDAGIID